MHQVRCSILHMTCLEYLWVHGSLIDAAILSHLGSLYTLSYLFIETENTAFAGVPPSHYLPSTFPNLRHLTLSPGVSAPDAFLPLISAAPKLVQLSVPWVFQSNQVLTGACIEVMLEHIRSFASVQHFSLSATEGFIKYTRAPDTDGKLELFPNARRFLTPLLSLGKNPGGDIPGAALRTLDIRTHFIIILDNAFLRDLARALPRIERLALIPACAPGPGRLAVSSELVEDILTFDGLIPLIESCLHLEDLKIAVRSGFSDTFDHVGARTNGWMRKREATARVRRLELWATPLNHDVVPPEEVSSFICGVFTSLTRCDVVLYGLSEREVGRLQHEEVTGTWVSVLKDAAEVLAPHRSHDAK